MEPPKRRRRIDPEDLSLAALALRKSHPELAGCPQLLVQALATLDHPAPNPTSTPAEPPPAGQLLSVKETGRRLGLSRRTVFTLIARGTLPRIALGRRTTRIPLSAVIALAAGGCHS